MNKRALSLAISSVLAASLAVPAAAADVDLDAPTVGPNGEASTAVADIPPLSDEEVAQIQDAGYKAALMWAGAGTWYNALTKGAKERFEELGIEVVAEAEADFDMARQQTDLETTMALQPDIILSLPVDPVAGTAAFRPAADAGAVIVFVDNGVDDFVPGEDYASIVTGDHFEMGKTAAQLMSDAIGGAGKIGFIFHDAVYYVTNNRDAYAKAAFEQLYPDIEIVAEQGRARCSCVRERGGGRRVERSGQVRRGDRIKGDAGGVEAADEPVHGDDLAWCRQVQRAGDPADHIGDGHAGRPKLGQRDRAIALGEALAGIVEHERDVQVVGRRIPQQPLQEDLAWCRAEQVIAAHDLRH